MRPIRLLYVIPVLLFANMFFVMHLESTYQAALNMLASEKKELEDIKYHIQNTPYEEQPQKVTAERRDYFSNWWRRGSTTGGHKGNGQVNLIIGIPTVPRTNQYLTKTIESIYSQLPSTNPDQDTPWRDNIQFMIVNNRPGSEFPEFEDLKNRYASTKELVFVDNNFPQTDRFADSPEPDDFNNPNDVPGSKVRKQTYDLISLMKTVEGKSDTFMFMEDDFPICPSALDTFYYILRKASYYQPNWKAIRTSYGMNGIFVRSDELPNMARFFDENVAHRPPDGLAVEWMCGSLSPTVESCERPQRHMTFKWNLFKHIGSVSSLRETGFESFPGCWAFYSQLLWEVDGFNFKECEDDDLWPCSFRPNTEQLHRTLDMDGWPYINSYIQVSENYGEMDVALRQRSLRLIWSGYSAAGHLSPSPLFSFLATAFCVVIWKILL